MWCEVALLYYFMPLAQLYERFSCDVLPPWSGKDVGVIMKGPANR